MGEIVVIESLSLDGVMQAPGRADEDPRGGFPYGGWATPYADEIMGAEMAKGMARPGVMLFGRRTYEALAAHWPKQTDGNPYTEKLNKVQKYVVSSTLTEPLPWVNSTLIGGDGDVPASVGALRDETDIAVLGSGRLVRTLAAAGLVDRYVLLIHPLTLGTGLRLFDSADGTEFGKLRLVDSVTTGTGVIIATYQA
jgi:dihydrofolate reductase